MPGGPWPCPLKVSNIPSLWPKKGAHLVPKHPPEVVLFSWRGPAFPTLLWTQLDVTTPSLENLFELHRTPVSQLGCHNKISKRCGLNTRNLFFTILEVGNSKIKVPTELVPGEGSPPCLQMDDFLLCPQVTEKEREHSGFSSSSYKDTDAIMGVPHSWLPLSKITSQDLTSRASAYELWVIGHKHSIYSTKFLAHLYFRKQPSSVGSYSGLLGSKEHIWALALGANREQGQTDLWSTRKYLKSS